MITMSIEEKIGALLGIGLLGIILYLFKRLLKPRLFVFIIPVRGVRMIVAGQTAAFLGIVAASDNSTVTAANWAWSASDPGVTIAADSSDPSGATVAVTVPAADTETTFALTATAEASSNTSPTPQTVSGSLEVTVSPAPVPVTFTLTIEQK